MNAIKNKSFEFALKIIELCRKLQTEQKEFVLSRQLLRSGTAIGALYREAEHAESKPDFIHKLAIAQKECNETIYWLELLKESKICKSDIIDPLLTKAVELIKILTSIIKASKSSINN